jgi:hypothetical protein
MAPGWKRKPLGQLAQSPVGPARERTVHQRPLLHPRRARFGAHPPHKPLRAIRKPRNKARTLRAGAQHQRDGGGAYRIMRAGPLAIALVASSDPKNAKGALILRRRNNPPVVYALVGSSAGAREATAARLRDVLVEGLRPGLRARFAPGRRVTSLPRFRAAPARPKIADSTNAKSEMTSGGIQVSCWSISGVLERKCVITLRGDHESCTVSVYPWATIQPQRTTANGMTRRTFTAIVQRTVANVRQWVRGLAGDTNEFEKSLRVGVCKLERRGVRVVERRCGGSASRGRPR